jgi:hypothetical protein
LVEEVFTHQDQMARVADRCLKFEEEDGYAGFQVNIAVCMAIVVYVVIHTHTTYVFHITETVTSLFILQCLLFLIILIKYVMSVLGPL